LYTEIPPIGVKDHQNAKERDIISFYDCMVMISRKVVIGINDPWEHKQARVKPKKRVDKKWNNNDFILSKYGL